MNDLDALLRAAPPAVNRLELRRLVSSVRARVLGAPAQTTMGRYVLEDKLGEGGFGIVYRAFDPTTMRRVALKVLRSDPAGASPRALREEARALAAINSEHVVRVLDFGSEGGQDFFVMDLVQGRPLRTWTPQSRQEALSVLEGLFFGVEAIHAQRLAHCDLKPDNVFIDARGRPVVVDFGLALSFRSLAQRTDPVGGSPPYSAPEQFTKAPIDARVDQYALGRIGLELLRRTPKIGQTRHLYATLHRASAPDASARFESVAALRRALQQGVPLMASIAASFASVAAVIGIASWASPPDPVATTANGVADERPSEDPLRALLIPIDQHLRAEDLEAAQSGLDAIPTQVWLDGDPSAQADEQAMQAELARVRGDVDESRRLLESAVWLAVDGERHETVVLHASELAVHLAVDRGDAGASERAMTLAWSAVVREGSSPRLVARYWNARAHIERFSGRPGGELQAARKAVEALESTPQGPNSDVLTSLGSAHLANGQLSEAKAAFERAIQTSPDSPVVAAQVAPQLATIEWQIGDTEEAIALARRAAEASHAARGAKHPMTVDARSQLGLMLIESYPSEAVTELRAVMETYGTSTGVMASVTRANLGMALAFDGQTEAGESMLLRALADLDAEGTAPLSDVAYIWGMLGDLRARAEQHELAGDAYRQGLSRLPAGADMDELRADLEARLAGLNAATP